jgi:hypothetical protein
MVALAKHRFTVRDFYRMAETGVLAPDARVELLEGEIIDMSPIGPIHGSVTKRLIHLFSNAARNRWLVAVQDPVRLNDHSEPQPDLTLLRPSADFYQQRHPQSEDVYLLVEVADTSLATDQELKLPAYARAGIAEVWIVNLNDLVVEVYREPQFNGYGSRTLLRPGDVAHPQAFPDVAVDLGGLLRR